MLVNEIDINNHLDNKLQYDFLLNSLRSKTDLQQMKASKVKEFRVC